MAEARPVWQPAPTVSRRLAACWQTLGRHGYSGQLSRPCAWGWGTDRPNPTDRRKKGSKHTVLVDERGTPLVILTCGSHVSDDCQMLPAVLAFPKIRGMPGAPRTRPRKLYADHGYDSAAARAILRWLGIKAVIAQRNREHGSGLGKVRWVVERTISWLKGMRRMRLRYDRLAMMQLAWNALAASVMCFRLLE
ncbi:MAG: transposase [Pirellulales bacterium]|nr:transposase [Pirellulales bacterium]